jgi:hypothetical protein
MRWTVSRGGGLAGGSLGGWINQRAKSRRDNEVARERWSTGEGFLIDDTEGEEMLRDGRKVSRRISALIVGLEQEWLRSDYGFESWPTGIGRS